MARKQNHLRKLSDKYKAANKLKRTKTMSSAGIFYEKPANIQLKSVDGENVVRQQMKGKEKPYKTSKPLI